MQINFINLVFTGSETPGAEHILFFGLGLRALFCACHFPVRKHEFSAPNSYFSGSLFMGSVSSKRRRVIQKSHAHPLADSIQTEQRLPPRKRGRRHRPAGRRCCRRVACGRRPSRRPCSPTPRRAASSPPASPSMYVLLIRSTLSIAYTLILSHAQRISSKTLNPRLES
jgi:hypothetical protein